MKHLSIASLSLAVLLPIIVQAQEGSVAIFSFADTSCGAWVNKPNSSTVRAQYYSWFRGFVSGYNFAQSQFEVSIDKMPNEQTLFLYVDKFCRESPLNTFVGAAFKLVEEVRTPLQGPPPKQRR
jgi:hypothetical protein